MVIFHKSCLLGPRYYFNHGRWPLSCSNQYHRNIFIAQAVSFPELESKVCFSSNVTISGPVCYSNKSMRSLPDNGLFFIDSNIAKNCPDAGTWNGLAAGGWSLVLETSGKVLISNFQKTKI